MEQITTLGIVDSYYRKLKDNLFIDVAIVGGGPSALVAGYYLAKLKKKVAIFERKLAPGGGMWGGGMMFNQVVVQNEALSILNEFNISYTLFKDKYYLVDSVESTASLIYHTIRAGAKIFNCYSVEDVVLKNKKVNGIVVNWGTVHDQGLHVDPLVIVAKCVIEATGHSCEVAKVLAKKNGIKLHTETGGVVGEKSLAMEQAERSTIENTKEIYPGLYVCGMAANGVSGDFRMGPIFGGMLMSGKKIAEIIAKDIT
jgi:thiazole biosynthesis enzyme